MIIQERLDAAMAQIKIEQETLRRRGNAALALTWFSRFALSNPEEGCRRALDGVLVPDIKPVASATPEVDRATVYLNLAYREFRSIIVERAIELAEEDYAANMPYEPKGAPDGRAS